MISIITFSAVGILIAVIGILNICGNVSTIHYYHRQRVREEDKKPFGKLVGTGTLVIAIGIIACGILTFIFERTHLTSLVIIGISLLFASIIFGTSISFYAMKKYNGGIF